ncbi:MAG TPA: DoxX family membrane protein [Thermoanaerobaculia bacterium]|nr:DoxX family membrane protein [Thermoanaerobaculia bacterium]
MSREWRTDLALLLLRLSGLGLAFAHGWGKVIALSAQGGDAPFVAGVAALGFPFPLVFAWAAALAELAGGLLIAVGLFTRIAAAAAAIAMAVAAFLRHRFAQQILAWLGILEVSDETRQRWGSPELAAVYLAILLALVLMGGGRFSLARLVRRSTRRGR